MTPNRRQISFATLLIAAFAVWPSSVDAQRRGRQETQAPWPSIMAGVSIGYDDNSDAEVLGAQMRVPLMRSGKIELLPSGTITFARALKEYQMNVEAVFVTGGRRGGLYAGGGVAYRNTILGNTAASPRETIQGYTFVLGLKGGGGGGLLGSQVALRWSYFDEINFDPRTVTLGINFALTGRARDRGNQSP